MAFKLTYNHLGITVTDAVWTVDRVTLSPESINFELGVRAVAGGPLLNAFGLECPYDPDGATPAAQAEAHALTLAEFSGGVAI